jgi:hypothetical protein
LKIEGWTLAKGLTLNLTCLLSGSGAAWATAGDSAALTLAGRVAIALVVMEQAVPV